MFVTPGATALHLTPKKEVSRAVVSTSMFTIAIDVEKIMDPGYGALPALLESIVMHPLVSLRKGMESETSWKLALTFKFII